jgi:isopenicillin-N epimerase
MRLARRDLIRAGLIIGSAATMAQAGSAPSAGAALPGDQAYWRRVAALYDVTEEVVQLENGNFGTMARPVAKAYAGYLDMVNRRGSYYSRREYGPDILRIRKRVAAELGVGADEIAFNRGATEALIALIGGYNRLKPGDAVLYADLDYDAMQAAVERLRIRRGVEPVKIALPEPATHQGLADAYDSALKSNPRIRLMLLTHVSHRNGLVQPVKKIAALAKTRGVDVILDSAHAWGQLDFTLPELGVDFAGLTCQKWIGAPLGVGLMYIRGERIADIDPALGNDADDGGIDARIHTGTSNFAAVLAVADALDVRRAIGAGAIESRLRALRDRWAEELRGRIEVLTPVDARLTCGITSFRLRGCPGAAENKALAAELLERFGIFTVDRQGLASGAAVRVTPGIFTADEDIDRLIAALKTIAA